MTFTNANTAASPTLNINSTGSKPIYTNGVQFAYWTSGATVVFVYTSGNWYSASTPVYANTATIGNPADKNICIDSDSVDIRTGSIVSSSFTTDTVSLGTNSPSATINMRGNTFSINTHKEEGDYGEYGISQIENIGDNFRIHVYNEDVKDQGSGGNGVSENYRETSIESQYASGTLGSHKYNSMGLNLFTEAIMGTSEAGKSGAVQIYSEVTDEWDSTNLEYKGKSTIRLLADKIYLYDNALLADFVFESGTKDNWHYKKWINGEMELWKEFSIYVDHWNSWGSIVESDTCLPDTKYPMKFVSDPGISCELVSSDNGGFIMGFEISSSTESSSRPLKEWLPKIYLLRATAYGTPKRYYFRVRVRGEWK